MDTIILIITGGVAVWAVCGSLFHLHHDGYRRVPTAEVRRDE